MKEDERQTDEYADTRDVVEGLSKSGENTHLQLPWLNAKCSNLMVKIIQLTGNVCADVCSRRSLVEIVNG